MVPRMPAYQEKRLFPFSAAQMYAVAADVRAYPDFLPWCQEAIILEEADTKMVADLVVGEGPLQGRFRSLVTLKPSERIEVAYQSGPLKYLTNVWVFAPHSEDGTTSFVDFAIDFELDNFILARLMGVFFESAVVRMMTAFEQRACALYSQPTPL